VVGNRTYRPSAADTVEQHGTVLVHAAAVGRIGGRWGPCIPRGGAWSRAGQRALRRGGGPGYARRSGRVH
jgi:hypothetical protein